MVHAERRSTWQVEFVNAAISGCLYGGTNTIVGHPFDTLKTKVQTQAEHMSNNRGYVQNIKDIYRAEGSPVAFYRGCIPPFIGSMAYRSTQFCVFEAFYTRWQSDPAMCKEIPGMMGLEWRTFYAGFAAGSVRSFVECPFEYAKVQGQTGQKWQFNQIYTGMRVQYPRATAVILFYFSLIELARKNTNLFNWSLG